MFLRGFAAAVLLLTTSAPALATGTAVGRRVLTEQAFELSLPGEVIATLTAGCDACSWRQPGREAAMLTLWVDGRYSQHLMLLRGGTADYQVALGPVEAGAHTLRVELDTVLSAHGVQSELSAKVERVEFTRILDGSPGHAAAAFAPILYARPDTVGTFTDVPAFMWYEVEPTDRGTRFRYSVIFTNEDGGTPTDQLMATWGRTTDIEYVYSVEIDAAGTILADDYQGPDHEILAFAGRREGRHPLLWVSTTNNMVRDRGTTAVRYAPVPVPFDLHDVSREAVMDAHPWTYAVMAEELAREGKIVEGSAPGSGAIPDVRRFVYVEACGEVANAALAVAVRSRGRWFSSDRGVPQFRIVRSGCFRVAVPLPAGTGLGDVRALRVRAFGCPPAKEAPPTCGAPAAGRARARVTRINKVFMLDERFVPMRSVLVWTGRAALRAGGAALEIPIP